MIRKQFPNMGLTITAIDEYANTRDENLLMTAGDYIDEVASVNAFDAIIESSGFFRVYKEVRGYYTQPREGQERKDPRIDRIISPTPELLRMGWTYGFVGVECKRSGIKANTAIAQMMDYQRAIWTLNSGHKIHLSYCFLWHLKKCHGFVGSLFAQQKLGSAYVHYNTFTLSVGEHVLFRLSDRGVEIPQINVGNRAGSR
jgi:hypothetical protein